MEVREVTETPKPDGKVLSECRLVKYLYPGDSFGQFSCFFNIGEKHQIYSGDQEAHLASYNKLCGSLP